MKKTIFIATIALALIAGATIFAACTKEDNYNRSRSFENKNLPTSIPYYDDVDDVDLILNTVMTFDTITDLIAYESSQGRQSIGAISDYFVEHIDTTTFTNTEAALAFCYQNSDLLDIKITDNDTVVSPKWSNTPFRYVANSEGYFAIGNKVYRLFNDGIVTTSVANYDYLCTLDEMTNFDNLETSIYYYSKYYVDEPKGDDDHTQCKNFWGYVNTKTNGKDRVNLCLTTTVASYSYGRMYETYIYVRAEHKCLGIWWSSRRTLTANGYIDFHIKNTVNNNWFNVIVNTNKTQKNLYLYYMLYRLPVTTQTASGEYHYYSFDLKANSLNVYYAILNSANYQ